MAARIEQLRKDMVGCAPLSLAHATSQLTTIAIVPFHHLPIDAQSWYASAAMEDGATEYAHYSLISPKMMKDSFVSAILEGEQIYRARDSQAPPWKTALPGMRINLSFPPK
jgi:hypothetical protein